MTTFTDIEVTSAASVSVSPTGNSTEPTVASTNIQASTGASNTDEFLLCVGLTSSSGSSDTYRNKVAIYSGIEAHASSGNIWSINPLVEVLSSAPTTMDAQGIELDVNNNNSNRGETEGTSGIQEPFISGITLTGAGAYRSTAAALVWAGPTPIWNRGFCVNSSVAQAAFCDYSYATTSVSIEGSHIYGLDLYHTSSSYPIRLGNAQAIWARNGADSGQIALMWTDGSNNIWMGQSSPNIITQSSVIPYADNTYLCGGGFGANAWNAVYSYSYPSPSDPALKSDISPLPSVLDVIKGVEPKTYKWKVERREQVDEENEELVQATEWIETNVEEVEIRDGQPTLVTKLKRREELVFDDIPVKDESGQPIYDDAPQGLAVSRGQSAKGERRPRLHRTPRMVKKVVKVTKLVDRPGTRTHWGFMAPEIKAAFDKLGMDFGGHTLGAEGRQHLAYDELIAVLWKGTQELLEGQEALRARITVLEASAG